MKMQTAANASLTDASAKADIAERRKNVRHQATYRPCCVIAAEKVTIGLIRNISDGGAHIEADVQLSVGEKIQYFCEANNCVTAQIVWRHGDAYGLKHFEKPATQALPHPARSVRIPCDATARCWINGQLYTVSVENLSLGGIRLEGLPQLEKGTLITIDFCGTEFGAAVVRWFKEGKTGLKLSTPLTRNLLARLLIDDSVSVSVIEFN